MLALVVAEGFAIILLGVLVTGLLRSHAEILRALHELGASIDPDRTGSSGSVPVSVQRPASAGDIAHDISGTSRTDEVTALAIVGAPGSTLLAFLSSGCATCEHFWTAFADRNLAIPGAARLVVVVQDAGEESPSRLRELAPPGITLVHSGAAWADYQVPSAPYFVYVDGPTGRVIGEGTAATWPQVANLLGQALADAPAVGRAQPASPRTHDDPDTHDPDTGDAVDRELLRAGIGPGHPSLYGREPAEPAGPLGTAEQR